MPTESPVNLPESASLVDQSLPVIEGLASANATGLPDAAANATAAAVAVPEPIFAWGAYFEAMAWLFLCLALLWLVLWFVKKRGGLRLPGSPAGMFIESRLSLGPKKWLLVVRHEDRKLLLGVTEHHISLLANLPGEEDEDYGEDLSGLDQDAGFDDFLKKHKGTSRE